MADFETPCSLDVAYDPDTGDVYHDLEFKTAEAEGDYPASWVDYQYALELLHKDIQSCPPNDCIIIRCKDQVFIEEDCLTDDARWTWTCEKRARSNVEVQEMLAEWNEYRKAFHKAWNENESMREALSADPNIPIRKFDECIEEATVYYDSTFLMP